MKLCRHCSTGKVNRPRGLCWTCYYSPTISCLYPSTSKYNRRGLASEATQRIQMEPHWRSDPGRRRGRCVVCAAGLYVDEPGQYCQDCRGVLKLISDFAHKDKDRSLWTEKEKRAHRQRVKEHARRVWRECQQMEAV